MFRNPFSFSGRIRRLEYGLSYIIFLAAFFMMGMIIEVFDEAESLFFLIILPGYWFIIAQGTKRCHDLGSSGFFQLIPFYGLIMIFGEGQDGNNRYGYNPKENHIPTTPKKPFQFKVALPKNRTILDIGNELLCIALLNTLFAIIIKNYIQLEGIRLLLIGFSFIPCYFLLLVLSHKRSALPNLKPYLFRHRVMYAIIIYVLIQLYNLVFLNLDFSVDTIVSGIFLILLITGITYIPFLIYPRYFKNEVSNDERNNSEIIKY
ncbi:MULTISPECIES: DUF805 domain-containing protein [Aquimarina]|uniref:DUF805 domain-containing protein n=1 Tax=Aquimarina algiphila TaxID=2047982 RepID=A0A554VL51_9FLAO|nr:MULTISPECIES: DUF805 domain-containing protein [Aquimarina]TSE08830.1 DUF805 domain-containing protein [Aquimarina algiphila]